MRWIGIVFFSATLGAAEIGGSNVHTVFVMPMTRGLDQYVANWLTRDHVFEVTADPKRADAVFTDRVGESLEDELDKLNPPAKPEAAKPEAEKPESAKAEAGDKKADSPEVKETAKEKDAPAVRQAPKMLTEEGPPRQFTSGRGKGTLFLVDTRSRAVLWSLYEKPSRTSPKELDRTAKRIVDRLKRDLSGK